MRGTIATRLSRRWLMAALALLLAFAQPGVAGQGLVYAMYRDGALAGYLLGTMHSEDPRVTGLLRQFAPLIEQVEVVMIELVPDAVALLAVAAATLLPPGQSLRELIGDQRFEAVADIAAPRGMPIAVLDRLRPWAAAVTLGMPAAESGRFLDMEIYLKALQLQRRVVGLETVAEQLAVFDAMPSEVQLLLLEEVVKNAAQMPKQLEELTSAFLAGNLDSLDRVARAQYGSAPVEIGQWFDDVLIGERNARMLARLAPLLQQQRVLIAVGAMHLVGDTGLIAGLRRLGYRLERWRG